MREQNADCSGIIATSIWFAMRRQDGNGSFWPCSLFLPLFAAKDQSSVHLSRSYSPDIGRPGKRMWHMIMAILQRS
jgi:hypothetical protein